MAKGGSRPGAGRPKGAINRIAAAEREALLNDGGLTPLAYMTRIFRDERADQVRRDDMAKAAAPYFHPKLANVEVGGKNGEAIKIHLTAVDARL